MNFHNYDISSLGFLPEANIRHLPQSWIHIQPLVDNLSTKDGQKFRELVRNLPSYSPETYSINKLNLGEKKLLYSLIVLIVQKYVWGCGPNNLMQEVPEELGNTMFEVAEDIGFPPQLTYAAIIFYNWAVKDEAEPISLDNLKLTYSMLDTEAYEWFCLVHVAIEARGGEILKRMIEAKEHMKRKDDNAIIDVLSNITEALKAIATVILRMYEKCSPEDFWDFRFLFEGTADPLLFPEGLKLKGGKYKPLIYKGTSATQSSLIQSIDSFFSVKHEGHGSEIFMNMRSYMPQKHRKFVEDLAKDDCLRDYVMKSENQKLLTVYNKAIDRLTTYRRAHLKLVHDYIIAMVNKQKALAKQPTLEQSQKDLYKEDKNGTSGTDAKMFLEEAVHETRTTKTVLQKGSNLTDITLVEKQTSKLTPVFNKLLALFIIFVETLLFLPSFLVFT